MHVGAPQLVTMSAALAISGAMALPFSSFPNVNSLLVVDELHRPYLSTRDFLFSGIPFTMMMGVLILTVGWMLIDLFIGGGSGSLAACV